MQIPRENRLWSVACAIVACVYVLSVPRIWQCEGVDEMDYLGLARSLARGEGYAICGEPHVLYPPLFPTMLSLIARWRGVTAWRWMYAANALLGVSGWILIGTWMRRRFGRIGRWAAWALLLGYYPWSFPCRFLMSEPLFLPLSFGALILAWRILDRNAGRAWEYALFGALCLLGAMTRAAAFTLYIALTLSGLARWWGTRRRAGLAVAALAFGLGVGFFAFWSVRADLVNPAAPESHWRWAKKYLGISKETEGIIARGEEVTDVSASPVRRVVFCAQRYGQFVLSNVRVPRNYTPLAGVLFSAFVTGLAVHGRRRSWSPLAWYTAVFLAMILMTTWLSNYHRFMVVLAPFLFLFLLEGLRSWYRVIMSARGRWAAVGLVVVGIFGLLWSARVGGGVVEDSDVRAYAHVISFAAITAYAGLIAMGLWRMAGRGFPHAVAVNRGMAAVIVVLALNAGTLAALRFRMTLNNATLRERNLEGALWCGAWMERNTPPNARCVSSVPRAVNFLADRSFRNPLYDAGALDVGGADYVLLVGPLRQTPEFRAGDEDELFRSVRSLESGRRVECVFVSGDASVYRVLAR